MTYGEWLNNKPNPDPKEKIADWCEGCLHGKSYKPKPDPMQPIRDVWENSVRDVVDPRRLSSSTLIDLIIRMKLAIQKAMEIEKGEG